MWLSKHVHALGNTYSAYLQAHTQLFLIAKRNLNNIAYPRFIALLAFVLNEKYETIVAIARQYPFGTDKADCML